MRLFCIIGPTHKWIDCLTNKWAKFWQFYVYRFGVCNSFLVVLVVFIINLFPTILVVLTLLIIIAVAFMGLQITKSSYGFGNFHPLIEDHSYLKRRSFLKIHHELNVYYSGSSCSFNSLFDFQTLSFEFSYSIS